MVGESFEKLVQIMARLRGPKGCPWDREQDLETLRPYLLEETHEVLEALDSGDPKQHREELGDLLLQIVFQSQIASEAGDFSIGDVIDGISEKLIQRHPHVFGDRKAATSREVIGLWREVKQKENKDLFDGLPATLPALSKAKRIQERVGGVGFDWPDISGVIDKIKEELSELEEAIDGQNRQTIADEMGDLLFSVVNLSRFTHLDPEGVLQKACRRFIARFEAMEDMIEREGKKLQDLGLEEMDYYWEKAKRKDSLD